MNLVKILIILLAFTLISSSVFARPIEQNDIDNLLKNFDNLRDQYYLYKMNEITNQNKRIIELLELIAYAEYKNLRNISKEQYNDIFKKIGIDPK